MTSEAPHGPGQEPGEVPPGAGGSSYGDRTPQQANGYPGTPDLGWAPPPPGGRPGQPAPGWATQDDQAPAPAWAPPGGHPPAATRGTAQVPQQAEPAGWPTAGGSPQTGWAAQEQADPAWASASVPGAHDERSAAGVARPQQNGHTWAAAPDAAGSQPAWGSVPGGADQPQPVWPQAGEPSARGAAQVPGPNGQRQDAWPAPAGQPQDDPARSGGWDAGSGQQDDPARSGGWDAGSGQQDDPARSGGWAVGAAAQQHGGQATWAQHGEQAPPPWSPTESAARGAARVPAPAMPPEEAWTAPDDATRSGGWATEGQRDDPARSGSWAAGAPDDDSDRSGGWAAGRAAQSEPSSHGAPANGHASNDWSEAATSRPHDDRPAPDRATPQERPHPSIWDAASPRQGDDQPDSGAWPPAAPARASASVPSPDGPPAWGTSQDNPSPWAPEERPAIPDAQPWAAGEAWGRSAETATPQQSGGWEPARPEDSPAYQPAQGPGISPTNAVPLPPQEQRVPGATLAGSPPADYAPSGPFSPDGPAQAEPGGREAQPYGPAQSSAVPAWGSEDRSDEEPRSGAAPVIPAPRTSPESGAVGSASVPLASRVTPPADQPLPASTPAPQPRVYGRPSRPEPEDAAEQDGPQFRSDGDDRPGQPNAFAEVPAVPSAPPSSPAGPPPFPPGMPSFVDPAGNSRPVNGVHPHSAERAADPYATPADPYGAPGGPFGSPGGPFGSPAGPGDPFGGPAGGRAAVNAGQGPGAMNEHPYGFPPPQQAPAWHQGVDGGPEQGRFDAFTPDAEPKTEAPAPKVRNGRVLAAVLIAAVLILAVPLGLLTLLGKVGGDNKPAGFDPAVGSCVKQSGGGAVAADCGEQNAFTVVSKADSKDKCGDPTQPHVVLPGDGPNRVLCLRPAGK